MVPGVCPKLILLDKKMHKINNLIKIEPSVGPMCELKFFHAHIMVVDDDPAIRDILKTIIEAEGYLCTVASDGQMAETLIQNFETDVVITDVDMPNMNGIELIKRIKRRYSADVIVMTGNSQELSYVEFIEIGASDFVQKPVMPSEMITRVKRVLKERCYRAENLRVHQNLVAAHEELKTSYLDTIHRLVLAAEYKDEDTGDHIVRIGRFSTLLAKKVGLPEMDIVNISYAAPMHDIGKIGIPDQILLKPGKLTPEEFEVIKSHTMIGAKILAKSKSPIIRYAQQIAISHHERWDGTGYPQGLVGKRIPIAGRIVALADTFDALTSQRPYKPPYPLELSIDIMQRGKGTQFDPDLLTLFLENIDSLVEIKRNVPGIKQGELADFILSERDQAAVNDKRIDF